MAAVAVITALVLATAIPAGAAMDYRPALTSEKTTSVKVAESEFMPYTSSAAKKKAKRARRAKKTASARKILKRLTRTYPILQGTTVEIGDARGHQAIAYYRSGRIVISKSHKASLKRILRHEVWHIIDYRDNGEINWGENVPPSNAAAFR